MNSKDLGMLPLGPREIMNPKPRSWAHIQYISNAITTLFSKHINHTIQLSTWRTSLVFLPTTVFVLQIAFYLDNMSPLPLQLPLGNHPIQHFSLFICQDRILRIL